MCSSKVKLEGSPSSSTDMENSRINGINARPVLHPNRVPVGGPLLQRRNSLRKPTINTSMTSPKTRISPPLSPKLKSPRPIIATKQAIDLNGLKLSAEKIMIPRTSVSRTITPEKKLRKCVSFVDRVSTDLNYSLDAIVVAPGSIAAARREQVVNMQVQRKMKIAHYGRTKSAKFEGKVVPLDIPASGFVAKDDHKRCSFITSNSDPIYVAYHDEEWGIPVHNDNLLFELLVLTAAQVGSDWTSVLKKRQEFRDAFAGFDAETVSKFTEKKIASISAGYGIELSLVRGVVDNAKKLLEIQKAFGSFDKYMWGYVNNKPISTKYKISLKIPVKTSKSESMSKDMVRRGFRLVGPTVMHSFMQAAGLTNDHLVTCPRHLECII